MGWLETADRKEEGLNAADIDRRRSVVEHRDMSGKRKEGNFGKAVADCSIVGLRPSSGGRDCARQKHGLYFRLVSM